MKKKSINNFKNYIRKVFTAFLIGAFLCNSSFVFAGNNNLSPEIQLDKKAFRELFMAKTAVLSHRSVNEYIRTRIEQDKEIWKGGAWEKDKTKTVQLYTPNIEGLDEITVVSVYGLLKHIGQFAHVGLSGAGHDVYSGKPVVYIDSLLSTADRESVLKHEIDEAIKWEQLRTVLGLERSQMRQWIKDHIHLTDERLDSTGYEGKTAKQLAKEFHENAVSLKELYEKHKDFNFDYDYINKMHGLYGTDERDGDVNVGAKNTERGIPPIEEDKINCSAEGVGAYFIGSRGQVLSAIKSTYNLPNAMKHEVLGEDSLEIERKGVVFYLRIGKRFPTWTFKVEDKERVAKACNLRTHSDVDVPEIENDLIICSKIRVKEHFIGDGKTVLKAIRDKFDLPNTKSHKVAKKEDLQLRRGKGEDVVTFYFRKFGRSRHLVWAFKEGDKKRVAKVCSLNLRSDIKIPDLGEGMTGCSINGVLTSFTGDEKAVLKTIKNKYDIPEAKKHKVLTEENLKIKRGIKGKEVVFYLRKSGGRIRVWAFENKDKERIAKECNLKIKNGIEVPLVEGGMIRCSHRDLGCFVGGGNDVSQKIKKVFRLPEPRAHKVNKNEDLEIIRREKGKRIVFYFRKSGTRNVWTFKEEDKASVGEICGFAFQKEIDVPILREKFISFSGAGVSGHFVGEGDRVLEKIKEKYDVPEAKLHEVSKTEDLEIKRGEGVNEVTFYLRKYGAITVWAFKLGEKKKIAEACELMLQSEIKITECEKDMIRCSPGDLRKHFVGGGNELPQKVREKFGLPASESYEVETKEDLQITRGEEEKKITFYFRMSGTNRVWAFKEKDLEVIANECGFALRGGLDLKLEKLGIEDAIALLGEDPLRLQQYIRLYYPELAPEEVDDITITALNGIKGEWQEDVKLHEGYKRELEKPEINEVLASTDAHSFAISGKVDPLTTSRIQVVGAYTRKIVVRQDGTFSANIPLPKTGEENKFWLYAVNPDTKEISALTTITIKQTAEKENTEEAFLRLLTLKEKVLESIKKNPARYYFLLRNIEVAMLKHFTYSENEGFRYLEEKINNEKMHAKKTLLEAVLRKFKDIAKSNVEMREGKRLYFFQKYCIYEANHMREKGRNNLIIANEPGLGKTLTALILVNGSKATIIAPNAVVTTWKEQENMFLKNRSMEVLEGTYAARTKRLKGIPADRIVTNVEFTRNITKERKKYLSQPEGILVIDEADYLGNFGSQQSKGTAMLKAATKLLLTATPFKTVNQIRNILHFLRPKDSRFDSAIAFARAFPQDSPDALNALFLLLMEHTIRIRKEDVFEEYDPGVPLEEQSDRLPAKIEIDPEEEGQFYLNKTQCESIKELFVDYQSWCAKHKGWESQDDKRYYRFKEGYFSKRHALRQIMDDPEYIGESGESPKHERMDKIVEKEIGGEENKNKKILIFCEYQHQVEEYAKRYAGYSARTYYGGLRQNSNGYMVDETGKVLYFKVDRDGSYELDENKEFIPSNARKGKPLRALDHERIQFQENPRCRVMVASYKAGSMGVTFTAADAVVYDDLAPTYKDQYQAGDRAHRIDNVRKKYNVKYYWLQAIYPQNFLDSLAPDVLETYFSMGTFDQVHMEKIKQEGRFFHRVMDGIGSQRAVDMKGKRFMRQIMPFMFEDGGDTELEEDDEENGEEEPEGDVVPVGAGEEEKGSPAQLLNAIKNNDNLLKRVREGEGITAKEMVQARGYDRRTVDKEFEMLKAAGILVPVSERSSFYKFSDMMIGEREEDTKNIIRAVNNLEYKIGRTNKPLDRYEIPKAERAIVKKLIKAIVDAERAISKVFDAVDRNKNLYYGPRRGKKEITLGELIDIFREKGYFKTLEFLKIAPQQYFHVISGLPDPVMEALLTLNYDEARKIVKGEVSVRLRGNYQSRETARNLILATLDTIEGFKKAREKEDIKRMVELYRKHVIKYKSKKNSSITGQTIFFYETGKLRGLMANERPYFEKIDSPAELLRLAVPGLISLTNPEALDPIEVEKYCWKDSGNAKHYILEALFTIEGFKEAFEEKNIAKMAELYRERVIRYDSRDPEKKNGQKAFFSEVGGLRGLMANEQTYFKKVNSPAEFLRLTIQGLVDDNNSVALSTEEVEKPWTTRGTRALAEVQLTKTLINKLINAQLEGGRVYEIRYNADRLNSYETENDLGKYVPFEKILNAYVCLLRERAGIKNVKLKRCSEGLISVHCYKNIEKSRDNLVGKGSVDFDGDLSETEDRDKKKYIRTVSVVGMLNIALAAANIPEKAKEENQLSTETEYKDLLQFIKNQYRLLTGEEFEPKNILQNISTIILPKIRPIRVEQLVDYYRLSLKRLLTAA